MKNKHLRNAWKLLKETYNAYDKHHVMKLSASLSYYTVFSLPPMLVVIIGVCGLFYGREALQGEIFGAIKDYVGGDTAAQIQTVLMQNTRSDNNFTATIIGGATLLLGATGIFGEIQDSINYIWGLKTKPKKGLIKMLINRVLSFSMILVLGFVFVVSLILSSLLEVFLNKLTNIFSETMVNIFYYLNYGIMFLTIMILFAFIFKVLPDAKIKWRHVLSGAFVTTILFMIGKSLISWYILSNRTVNAYGAAGSLIIMLVWVYYSSFILYLGAEFTQVYAAFKGVRISPNRYAVFVEQTEEEIKQSTRPIKPEVLKEE